MVQETAQHGQLRKQLEALGVLVHNSETSRWVVSLPPFWPMDHALLFDELQLELEDEGVELLEKED